MSLHHSSTIALHNGSVAPGSCSGVRHRGSVRMLAAVVACCAVFAVQPLAEAQWVSGNISGTYDWGNTANWVGGTITNSISASSTATGDLTFRLSGTTFSSPIVFNAAFSGAQRTGVFQASSATQTLNFNNGSGYTGNGTLNNSSSMASSLILNLVSGTSAFNASNSRTFTIDSQITGAGSFAAGSSGRINLTNTANNFTGNLIVAQGGQASDILSGNVGTFGSPANLIVNGNLLFNAGGTYAFNNFSGGNSGNVYKPNGSIIAVFAPTSVISSTYAGFIGNEPLNIPRQSGQIALTKRGSGTLTLSTGTNAYSGPTTLEAGVLSIGRVADAGVTGAISGANTGTTGTIASTAGIQVGMNIFGISNGLAGAAGYSGTVTAVTSATTFTVSNAWTGNGSNLSVLFGFYSPLGISTTSTSNLVFNGGSLRYSGSAGATNRLFSIGTGGGGIIADGTTGQLVFSGTGTVGFNGQTGAREFTLSGTNTGTNTLNVVLADNAVGQATSLTKAGTGRWVLGGANTHSGSTTITGGTLQLENVGALSQSTYAGGSGSLAFGAITTATFGGLSGSSSVALSLTNTAGAAVALTVGGNNSSGTFASQISGAGSLTKVGTGTLVLTAAGYDGATTISAGALQVGDGGTSGSISGNVANSGGLVFKRANALTYSGTISGAGSLTQAGSGLLVLTGSNSYTGGSTISSGTLQVGDGGSTGWISGNVANSGALVFNRSDTQTYSGTISGAGSLTQAGSGTLVLTAANGYTGQTTISSGELQVGNGGSTGSIVGDVANSGRLVFNRSNSLNYSGTITGAGRTVIRGGTLALGENGAIATTGTVIVGDAGSSGARLDLSAKSAYTFGAAQTLGGIGTVAGGTSFTNVTISGVLSPGNSPGLLTFDNANLILDSTANTLMEITGTTQGSLYDAVVLAGGTITYGGTLTLDFGSNPFNNGDTFNLFQFKEAAFAYFDTVIATGSYYSGTFTNSGSGVYTLSGSGIGVGGNQRLTFTDLVPAGESATYYGQLVIVPEPLTLGLLGIGSGIAVVGLRRLRRRKANGANGTHTSEDTADAA
jgi:autotransporter-associated beta strand protein